MKANPKQVFNNLYKDLLTFTTLLEQAIANASEERSWWAVAKEFGEKTFNNMTKKQLKHEKESVNHILSLLQSKENDDWPSLKDLNTYSVTHEDLLRAIQSSDFSIELRNLLGNYYLSISNVVRTLHDLSVKPDYEMGSPGMM